MICASSGCSSANSHLRVRTGPDTATHNHDANAPHFSPWIPRHYPRLAAYRLTFCSSIKADPLLPQISSRFIVPG